MANRIPPAQKAKITGRCPFCGTRGGHLFFLYTGQWRVECDNRVACGAKGPKCVKVKEAIKLWNDSEQRS